VPALEPAAYLPETLPEEQRVKFNWASPVIEKMRQQKFNAYAKAATNKLSDLEAIGNKYGASGYYLVGKLSSLPSIPNLRLIQDSKENFGDSDLKAGDMSTYGYYTNAIHNGGYAFTDQKLLSCYLLTTDTSNLKGIPVVVSAQEAASLFGEKVGIGKEPQNAHDKRAWLSDIQTKLNGQAYQACYRNSTEQALLEKIQRDYADMKNNENTEGYKKPSLIYEYPTETCGDIIVKEDTRTALEKQADDKAEVKFYAVCPSYEKCAGSSEIIEYNYVIGNNGTIESIAYDIVNDDTTYSIRYTFYGYGSNNVKIELPSDLESYIEK
jgi:hypothetical protein